MFKVGDEVTFQGKMAKVMQRNEMMLTRGGVRVQYFIVTEDGMFIENISPEELT